MESTLVQWTHWRFSLNVSAENIIFLLIFVHVVAEMTQKIIWIGDTDLSSPTDLTKSTHSETLPLMEISKDNIC